MEFAQTHESKREMDFSDQERIFGTLLGSVPNDARADQRRWSSTRATWSPSSATRTWADPTYSVAKSMLSTVAGIAVRDGKIADLDEPVGNTVKDGGYDSPRNAQVTWKMHLQQESEWEGTMFGKKDDFIGKEAFGEGEMKPRELQRPGTYYEYNDVRINRFSLSLLRMFSEAGARRVPRRDHGPDRRVEHVAVGAVPQQLRRPERQEGGVGERRHALGRRHVDQRLDMARFGYLWLRGGKWGDQQILPPAYVKAATHAQRARPRLRLPVVAEHAGQELSRPADHRLRRPAAPAATPSSSCRNRTWWSCGAGTPATRPSSSSG